MCKIEIHRVYACGLCVKGVGREWRAVDRMAERIQRHDDD